MSAHDPVKELAAVQALRELAEISPSIAMCMAQNANIWAFPEHQEIRPVDDPDLPSVQTSDEEAEREQRWSYFIGDVRDFAASEPDGLAAVLRAVSEAMKQPRLFR